MNKDALLNYVSKCGMWFRATVQYDAPIGLQAMADFMCPPLDTDKVCKTRMARWLAVDKETGTIEGILFPEHVVSGMELLRGNCRALAFASTQE